MKNEKSSITSQNGMRSNGKSVNGSMKSSQLMKLFEDQLKDIYWAEKALTKAMPKMIKKATSPELTDALKSHLAETENHISRLEQVFHSINKKASGKKCEAMEGLIKEAAEIMESCEAGAMCDAGIILAGQKVEHYEIATYGTLCAFAKSLGENEAHSLLQKSLEEEKEADENLTGIAQSINIDAAVEDEHENDSGLMVVSKSKIK